MSLKFCTICDGDLLQVHENSDSAHNLNVYIWQHHFDVDQLISWTKSNFPDIAIEDYLDLRPKRLVERLSVQDMLNQILSQNSPLQHKENGAPYILHNDIHISVSHTRNTYGMSLSRDLIHGIDLEKWGTKALQVASMFIHPDEEILFSKLSDWGNQEQIATLMWSAKESVYKLLEISGLSFRDDIKLSFVEGNRLKAEISRFQTSSTVYFQAFTDFIFTCAVSANSR